MKWSWLSFRNLAAFWLFGLCNNYAYVIMLTAAEDIMDAQQGKHKADSGDTCETSISSRHCSTMSTGAVLLADILPTLAVKLTCPFFMHRIPFGFRHFVVVALQTASYFIVAYSDSVAMSLAGVVVASFGAGLGEITYLGLASHFSRNAISSWSSGTGGAGVVGSFAYSALTEPKMGNLSPKNALLSMLVVPALFAFAYWILCVMPSTVYSPGLSPSTWIVPLSHGADRSDTVYSDTSLSKPRPDSHHVPQRQTTFPEKLRLMKPLLHLMFPLALVYCGEYLINQGLVELIIFDCAHAFGLSRASQYRWYQVIYQAGVFISRSSVNFVQLPPAVLYVLPVLQLLNMVFFMMNALYWFVPHIGILFALILFEGLLGGSSYVNTFHYLHNTVDPSVREFSLGAASMGDSIGIVISGFAAIPLHNWVCNTVLPKHVL